MNAEPNHSSVFLCSRSEGVAERYVTAVAPDSDLKATSLQLGECLAGLQWVWRRKNGNKSSMVDTSLCTFKRAQGVFVRCSSGGSVDIEGIKRQREDI